MLTVRPVSLLCSHFGGGRTDGVDGRLWRLDMRPLSRAAYGVPIFGPRCAASVAAVETVARGMCPDGGPLACLVATCVNWRSSSR